MRSKNYICCPSIIETEVCFLTQPTSHLFSVCICQHNLVRPVFPLHQYACSPIYAEVSSFSMFVIASLHFNGFSKNQEFYQQIEWNKENDFKMQLQSSSKEIEQYFLIMQTVVYIFCTIFYFKFFVLIFCLHHQFHIHYIFYFLVLC